MKTAAVLPALGIGDALLMMIASCQLKAKGFQVITYHHALPELSPWFPGYDLRSLPDPFIDELGSFDLILVENDNTPKIKYLLNAFRPRLSIFYPTYSAQKHASLSPLDRVFDQNLPMADNIAEAIASLIDLPLPNKENDMTPIEGLKHRSKNNQVILHPTSREIAKNWKASGFISVAKHLQLRGLTPIFCVGPHEKADWSFVEDLGFTLANLPTLSALAALVYESNLVIGNDSVAGHLASNLNVPTIIIASDEKRMRLWRPGWLKGQLVLPPPYLPNWKFLRLKEKQWHHFISINKVLKAVDGLLL